VRNSRIKTKEKKKKRKSFGARPKRITPQMSLREKGHVTQGRRSCRGES
jgi:hypothetical protein